MNRKPWHLEYKVADVVYPPQAWQRHSAYPDYAAATAARDELGERRPELELRISNRDSRGKEA